MTRLAPWTPAERMIALRFVSQCGTFTLWLTVILATTQVLNEFHKFVGSPDFMLNVLSLFVAVSPSIVIIVLPFALLVAAYNVISTLNANQELAVLHCFGLSYHRICFPILLIAFVLSVSILCLSLFVEPDFNRRVRQLVITMQIDNIQRSVTGLRVHRIVDGLYIWSKSKSADGRMNDLFISDSRSDQEMHKIYLAREARIMGGVEKDIVFRDGEIQYKDSNTGNIATITFDRYAIALSEFLGRKNLSRLSARQRPTATLIQTMRTPQKSRRKVARHGAELLRRTSDWAYTLAFAGLGLLAARGTSRHGSVGSWGLLAVLVLATAARISGMVLVQNAGNGLMIAGAGYLLPFILTGMVGVLFVRTDGYLPRMGTRPHTHQSRFSHMAAAAIALWRHAGRSFGRLPRIRVVGGPVGVPPLSAGATLMAYIFGRAANRTVQLAVGILSILVLGQFFSLLLQIGGQDSPSIPTLFLLTALKVPTLLPHVVPYVILIATCIVIAGMTRHGEHVVIRASGMSIWRFLVPFATLAFTLGLATLAFVHPLIAYTETRAVALAQEIADGRTSRLVDREPGWLSEAHEDGMTLIHAHDWSDPLAALPDTIFLRFNANHDVIDRVEADRARLRYGYWDLENATLTRDGSQAQSSRYRIPSRLTPTLVEIIASLPENATIFSLRRKIRAARIAGVDPTALVARLHEHLSFPFLLVAMVLAAAAVTVQRAGEVSLRRIAVASVGIAFALYVARTVFGTLGQAGVISPALAAWSPTMLIGLTSVTALLYGEDG